MNSFIHDIRLSEEMLLMLLRGGVVNYEMNGVRIVLRQAKDLVVIKREDYQDLKRHIREPNVLECIFRNIDI